MFVQLETSRVRQSGEALISELPGEIIEVSETEGLAMIAAGHAVEAIPDEPIPTVDDTPTTEPATPTNEPETEKPKRRRK